MSPDRSFEATKPAVSLGIEVSLENDKRISKRGGNFVITTEPVSDASHLIVPNYRVH